jgi:hypothetical protein
MERDAKIGLGSSFRTKRREAQLSLTQAAPIDSHPALVMAERCSGRTLRRPPVRANACRLSAASIFLATMRRASVSAFWPPAASFIVRKAMTAEVSKPNDQVSNSSRVQGFFAIPVLM